MMQHHSSQPDGDSPAAATHEAGEESPFPPKTASGIVGLDEILLGGVPTGRTSLIRGGPGTGKTVLSLEFVYRGALRGEPGVFVTFEERTPIIRQNARAFGWDLAKLEADGTLLIVQPELPGRMVETGEFDVSGLLAVLQGSCRAIGASRIVIDAADIVLRLFRDPHEQEAQLFRLHRWLWEQEPTSMLTLKSSPELAYTYDRLEYMADCVMHLDNRVDAQVSTRRLRVIKYRGSGYLRNEFPCVITNTGFRLMPISHHSLSRPILGRVSSGNPGLDALLSGGYIRGTCVLIGGATGTGKTTLASEFVTAACQRRERVLILNFEESEDSLVSSMASVGLDLAGCVESGYLKIAATMPESRGAEEHLWRVFETIDEFQPETVVLDAISACSRLGSEEVAFDFLVRLLTHCRSHGISCLYTNQTSPELPADAITGVGISSLVDTLIVLSQNWEGGSHRRQLVIVKSRGSRHSHTYHEFQITDRGILIEDVPADSSADLSSGAGG